MALGFQDCCNSSNYFLLEGIPATVSEFEVYYIRTVQGENFCATYVNLPALNYSPPVYTLLEMTQQGATALLTACEVCTAPDAHPCPPDETIFLSQFGTGSVASGTDCYLKTLFPMVVECVRINPDFENNANGSVSLYVIGGTVPYSFYDLDEETYISPPLPDGNIYLMKENIPEGVYRFRVSDAQGDFVQIVECELDAPAPPPVISCVSQSTPVYGAPFGEITDLIIQGGTPPYTIRDTEGNLVNFPLTNLLPGNYVFVITDSGVNDGINVQYVVEHTCVLEEGREPSFPDSLCVSFLLCGQRFNLRFNLTEVQINFRPTYQCTSSDAQLIGVSSFIIQWDNEYNGWTTNAVVSNGNIQLESQSPCPILTNDLRLFKTQTFSLDESPQQGSWYGTGFLAGVSVNVSGGFCAPTLFINNDLIQDACGPGLPGAVFLEGSTPIPPPENNLIYYYKLTSAADFNQSLTGGLIQLPTGDYVAYVEDSQTNTSDYVYFTISGTLPLPINVSLDCVQQLDLNSNATATFEQVFSAAVLNVLPNWTDVFTQVTANIRVTVNVSIKVDTRGQSNLNTVGLVFSPSNTTITTNGTTTSPFTNPASFTDSGWIDNGCVSVNPAGCPCNANKQGHLFARTRNFESQQIVINNTTSLNLSMISSFVNPITSIQAGSCTPYIGYSVYIELINLNIVEGCAQFFGVIGNRKEIFQYGQTKVYQSQVNNTSNNFVFCA